LQTHNDHQFHHYTHFHEAKGHAEDKCSRPRPKKFFEATSESEEKILASRPDCSRGLNITGFTRLSSRRVEQKKLKPHFIRFEVILQCTNHCRQIISSFIWYR